MEIEKSFDIIDYVMDKRDSWRNDYNSNYRKSHDEYYRLWRAQWSPEDRQRLSERSKLISPALQQAVESSVSEVEEATFGRGVWFDIKDDVKDQDKSDIEAIRNQLMEDLTKAGVRKDISEILLNAAVSGTGIGEVVLEEYDDLRPATREMMDGQLKAYGVERNVRVRVRLRPIHPNNFLIEPTATSVDGSVGVIIDEFVPIHQVQALQDSGVYYDGALEGAGEDSDIEPDKELLVHRDDKVRITKYYGLVPKDLIEHDEEGPSRYVEAVVVIANNGVLLKATENPYMMRDRPIVAFPWDIVPGRFWGRGICEKGYMSQKALDTELRARIDALGLIVHPMMAIDSTRMPRGFKAEIRPGRTIPTQGNPSEVLMPFKFGNLDANTFTQTQVLSEMVQQATGAVDSTGLLSSVSGDAKAGAVSMSLGAVIKRHKRTLINFQDAFLIPFISKAAWRYMQFDPEGYPAVDYKFTASSTLGIIAREYEVSQLISLLQTMSPDSPLYPALIRSIVDNMNLSNRETLLQVLEQASQPDPQQQQHAQQMQALQLATMEAQKNVYDAQANESNARAKKYAVEAELEPTKVRNDLVRSITQGMDSNEGDAAEFDRRMKALDMELKFRKSNQDSFKAMFDMHEAVKNREAPNVPTTN